MDAISDPEFYMVVWMKSSQVGATEVLNNAIGYYMDHQPAPMLIVQPTIEMAKAWSKDRLAPMLRDTPAINDKIGDRRTKDSENTILHKVFEGGHLTIAGANSPASLASRPVRILCADEVDRYPPSAGTEGDPLSLAIKRTVTFWNRIIYVCSSPTVKGESRIEAAFDGSNQQYYFVPCPECGDFQRLRWANVKWPKGRPGKAYYVCEYCGACIDHRKKTRMLAGGEWRASAKSNGIAGFHISELYSPWVTWAEMAETFVEAKRLPETLKTFVNTSLGETWEDESEKIEPDALQERAEAYDLPDDVLILTCAVDVQDDRLEVMTMGSGLEFESWIIDHEIFYGDPGGTELWKRIDEYISQVWERDDGFSMRIQAATIDSGGHFTDEVYKFCKKRYGRRVYAIKGKAGVREIISRPTKGNRFKCPLFTVGVDMCKDLVFWRLKEIKSAGPGYIHFHDRLDDEFFKQVSAEERRTKFIMGRKVNYYFQKRARNEALDLLVYNIATIELIRPDFASLAGVEDREEKPKEERRPHPLVKRQPRRSNFATSWK